MVSIKSVAMRSLPVVAALVMSACTVVPYEQARPNSRASTVPVVPEPELIESQPQEALLVPQRPQNTLTGTRPATSLPAAKRMRQLASVEGDKGDYKRAIALLERALRISPRDPETYYELARNHLLMDDPAQALQLAQRGLSLKPDPDQRRRLEQLVDDSKAKLTV